MVFLLNLIVPVWISMPTPMPMPIVVPTPIPLLIPMRTRKRVELKPGTPGHNPCSPQHPPVDDGLDFSTKAVWCLGFYGCHFGPKWACIHGSICRFLCAHTKKISAMVFMVRHFGSPDIHCLLLILTWNYFIGHWPVLQHHDNVNKQPSSIPRQHNQDTWLQELNQTGISVGTSWGIIQGRQCLPFKFLYTKNRFS